MGIDNFSSKLSITCRAGKFYWLMDIGRFLNINRLYIFFVNFSIIIIYFDSHFLIKRFALFEEFWDHKLILRLLRRFTWQCTFIKSKCHRRLLVFQVGKCPQDVLLMTLLLSLFNDMFVVWLILAQVVVIELSRHIPLGRWCNSHCRWNIINVLSFIRILLDGREFKWLHGLCPLTQWNEINNLRLDNALGVWMHWCLLGLNQIVLLDGSRTFH